MGSGPVTLFGESTQNAAKGVEHIVRRSYSRWIQLALAGACTALGLIFVIGAR